MDNINSLHLTDQELTIMILKEKLPVFGKIERLEFADNKLHVRLEKGFSIKATNTFKLIKLIIDTASGYELIDKCQTDDDLFHLVLKPISK